MSVPARFATLVHQLALGFEPIDALRGQRTAKPVWIEVESPLHNAHRPNRGFNHVVGRTDVIPGVARGEYGTHGMIFLKQSTMPGEAVVRIRDDARRYVPRRFRVEIPAQVDVDTDQRPLPSRKQRPLLFPGAAYDVHERSTGLRGRVLRGGQPMRWAWIDAFYLVNVGDDADPEFLRRGRIGRAISDDRGEFLLLLETLPQSGGGVPDLTDPIWVNVVVNGPSPAPAPTPAGAADQLWDVPVEDMPAAGSPDPAAAEAYVPAGYAADVSPAGNRNIPFRPGKMLTGTEVEDFLCSLP